MGLWRQRVLSCPRWCSFEVPSMTLGRQSSQGNKNDRANSWPASFSGVSPYKMPEGGLESCLPRYAKHDMPSARIWDSNINVSALNLHGRYKGCCPYLVMNILPFYNRSDDHKVRALHTLVWSNSTLKITILISTCKIDIRDSKETPGVKRAINRFVVLQLHSTSKLTVSQVTASMSGTRYIETDKKFGNKTAVLICSFDSLSSRTEAKLSC